MSVLSRSMRSFRSLKCATNNACRSATVAGAPFSSAAHRLRPVRTIILGVASSLPLVCKGIKHLRAVRGELRICFQSNKSICRGFARQRRHRVRQRTKILGGVPRVRVAPSSLQGEAFRKTECRSVAPGIPSPLAARPPSTDRTRAKPLRSRKSKTRLGFWAARASTALS